MGVSGCNDCNKVIDCEIEVVPENGEEVLFGSYCWVMSGGYWTEDGEIASGNQIFCDITQCSTEAKNRQECVCGGMVLKDGRAYSGDELSTYCSDSNQNKMIDCHYPNYLNDEISCVLASALGQPLSQTTSLAGTSTFTESDTYGCSPTQCSRKDIGCCDVIGTRNGYRCPRW